MSVFKLLDLSWFLWKEQSVNIKKYFLSVYKRRSDGVTNVDKSHSREIMPMHSCLVKKLFVISPNRLKTQALQFHRFCLFCLSYVDNSRLFARSGDNGVDPEASYSLSQLLFSLETYVVGKFAEN